MTNENIDWNSESIVNLRNTYFAASQRAFVPYKAPLIFKSGKAPPVYRIKRAARKNDPLAKNYGPW